MTFANYDHDGDAREFLIQVGTLPCWKLQFAAVGVSASRPRLHALTSVAKPGVQLVMPLAAWPAPTKSPTPQTVTVWTCGDHASDVRRELVVSAPDGRIHVRVRVYSCPEKGEPESLLEDTDG